MPHDALYNTVFNKVINPNTDFFVEGAQARVVQRERRQRRASTRRATSGTRARRSEAHETARGKARKRLVSPTSREWRETGRGSGEDEARSLD